MTFPGHPERRGRADDGARRGEGRQSEARTAAKPSRRCRDARRRRRLRRPRFAGSKRARREPERVATSAHRSPARRAASRAERARGFARRDASARFADASGQRCGADRVRRSARRAAGRGRRLPAPGELVPHAVRGGSVRGSAPRAWAQGLRRRGTRAESWHMVPRAHRSVPEPARRGELSRRASRDASTSCRSSSRPASDVTGPRCRMTRQTRIAAVDVSGVVRRASTAACAKLMRWMHGAMPLPLWAVALVLAALAPFAREAGSCSSVRSRERSTRSCTSANEAARGLRRGGVDTDASRPTESSGRVSLTVRLPIDRFEPINRSSPRARPL